MSHAVSRVTRAWSRWRTALVVRGEDGLDELTTTGTSQIWQVSGGEVQEFTLNPSDFGIKCASIEQLIGGDAQANAETANRLFAGETAGNLAAIRDIVILNAAGGVVAYELAKQLAPFTKDGLYGDFFNGRANISLDAGLLAEIDDAARQRGVTRSAFLAAAARDRIKAGA